MSVEQIQIVYDGECPFCSTYVRMFRLREMGAVQLFNSREPHPIVDEIRSRGLDLDEGMVLKMGGAYYHGEEVVHRLALMSGRSGLLKTRTQGVRLPCSQRVGMARAPIRVLAQTLGRLR